MAIQIFVNLPVRDLDRSVAFFTGLGFRFNPEFTDSNATSMIVSDDIYVMLLVEPFFKTFIDKPLCDARAATEAIVCLSLDSREAVDAMVAAAVKGGARLLREAQDHGFMYAHGFEDLDGHLWELVHMSGKS